MATIETSPLQSLRTVSITSIQPGGGLCFELERAWGKLRRACLRLFRPHYVERMLKKRQGQCSGCRHDIIDRRDLKLYRNVCGYWFRAEDDRFQYRDRLRLARAGLAEVVFFSLLCGIACCLAALGGSLLHPAFFSLFAIVVPLWVFLISFFRDPDRAVPPDPQALVSPADGTVTNMKWWRTLISPAARPFASAFSFPYLMST
jgi:phosphatidylserine decarboxylase